MPRRRPLRRGNTGPRVSATLLRRRNAVAGAWARLLRRREGVAHAWGKPRRTGDGLPGCSGRPSRRREGLAHAWGRPRRTGDGLPGCSGRLSRRREGLAHAWGKPRRPRDCLPHVSRRPLLHPGRCMIAGRVDRRRSNSLAETQRASSRLLAWRAERGRAVLHRRAVRVQIRAPAPRSPGRQRCCAGPRFVGDADAALHQPWPAGGGPGCGCRAGPGRAGT